MSVRVEINTDQLKSLGSKVGSVFRKAAVRAANRAIITVQAELVREVQKKIPIKQSEIKKQVSLKKATASDMSASLFLFGGRVPLVRFKPKKVVIQTPRGKRQGVSVDEGTGRRVIPGAFLGKAKSSGSQRIFKRKGLARLPIRQLFSSRLSEIAKIIGSGVASLQRVGEEALAKNFEREFNYYAEKEINRGK